MEEVKKSKEGLFLSDRVEKPQFIRVLACIMHCNYCVTSSSIVPFKQTLHQRVGGGCLPQEAI